MPPLTLPTASSACSLLSPSPRTMGPTAIVRVGEILQVAVSRGDLSRVRELLAKGAPADARGQHGTTALHWAAGADAVDIVTVLLQVKCP